MVEAVTPDKKPVTPDQDPKSSLLKMVRKQTTMHPSDSKMTSTTTCQTFKQIHSIEKVNNIKIKKGNNNYGGNKCSIEKMQS